MTTIATPKLTNIKVTFEYTNNYAFEQIDKFAKRIEKFVNDSHVFVTATIFTESKSCEAVLAFDENYMDKNDWVRIQRRLDTLINSHKEAAYWGFATLYKFSNKN